MAGEFEGKVVVVTGGSRGIGRAIAVAFAREGAQTVLAASNAANLAEAAKAVDRGRRPAPLTIAADLRTLAGCEQVFAEVNERFNRCDVLVNNAGATKGGNFFEQPDDAWSDGFALKFHAAVRLTQLFWPLLKAAHGNIVNIIGGAARTPGPEFLIGGAVNAAMANFAKGLAALGNRDDINVNVIHPGQTQTDRVEQLFQQFAKAQNKTVEAGARGGAGEERHAPHRPAGGRRRAGAVPVQRAGAAHPRHRDRRRWRRHAGVLLELSFPIARMTDWIADDSSQYRSPAAAASSTLPACGRRRARSASRSAVSPADDRPSAARRGTRRARHGGCGRF